MQRQLAEIDQLQSKIAQLNALTTELCIDDCASNEFIDRLHNATDNIQQRFDQLHDRLRNKCDSFAELCDRCAQNDERISQLNDYINSMQQQMTSSSIDYCEVCVCVFTEVIVG